jgi:hypothetical protein
MHQRKGGGLAQRGSAPGLGGVYGVIGSLVDFRKAQLEQLGREAQAAASHAWASGQSLGRKAADQALAGGRGVVDSLPFDWGNQVPAAFHATDDAVHGADWGRAFTNRMAAEHAQDRYDATHYRTARTMGQIAGTGLQLALIPTEGLAVGGVRMAQATPLIARELGVLGAAGGAGGVGTQAVSDLVQHRLGSLGDYAGAGLGGAVGALSSLGGRGGYAGMVDGAATSVAQDVFNGHAPSFDRARDAALTGGLLGTAAGVVGRRWSNGLTNAAKQKLGEDFSRLRTAARGDRTGTGKPTREYLEGRKYTYPDQRSYREADPRDLIESKFGRWARLRPRQIEAYEQLPNYRVDHTLPRDVGAVSGLLAASPVLLPALQNDRVRDVGGR